jgi:hypothetical protein
VTFWYGSGSADPSLWLTDPDSDQTPDLDPTDPYLWLKDPDLDPTPDLDPALDSDPALDLDPTPDLTPDHGIFVNDLQDKKS